MKGLCKIWLLMSIVLFQAELYANHDSTITIEQLPHHGLLLKEGWKMMPGDDPKWANPDWDSMDWRPIDPTQDIKDIPELWENDIVWFRLEFECNSLNRQSLALLVEQTGASEIYHNGHLIGKFGRISHLPKEVIAASPPFGEVISLNSSNGHKHVIAIRFAVQKNIPYIVFTGRPNHALALKVMDMKEITRLNRGNYLFLDFLKSGIFIILALLHLALYWYFPKRKANLYFFAFSILNSANFLTHGIVYQYVGLAEQKMLLLFLAIVLFNFSSLFFLTATYSAFGNRKGIFYYFLAGFCFLSLPIILIFYKNGWLISLIGYPLLVFIESARISLMASRKQIVGANIMTYGAIGFLILYPIFQAMVFGILPVGPNYILGHLAFNLGILILPLSLSIFLATEAGFTSRSLEAKLIEVKQLSDKALAQELENRDMQELDKVKSRFFENISHEFRTPLSIIIGSIENLKKKDQDLESRLPDYKTIQRSADNLLKMINQMLDLSKLEKGKLDLQIIPENLTRRLKILASTFASLFESKNISYHHTIPLQPTWVYMDEEKLGLIVNNLLSNAAKFTPSQGEVSFSANIQYRNDESCVLHMVVEDTGIGIPSSQVLLIFDRFYQSDNSMTRKYEGTGIGLALVKELVNLHGGSIDVDSKEGKGSIFKVQLLYKLAESRDMENTEASADTHHDPENIPERYDRSSVKKSTPRHQKHVLVIEDNAELRQFISSYISDFYVVDEATDGKEGLKKAKTNPDLIICDIMMPGLDGLSLCRKLKEDPKVSHIPIILLTAKADGESKIGGLKTGADEYMIKPFNAEELLVRINNLLNRQQNSKELFSQTFKLEPGEVIVHSPDEKFLQKVLKVVDENTANVHFDVIAFSREMGMSKTQLNRKLNALVGQSPNEFIRTYRLKKAAQLIKQHHGNIAEIAFEVGFSSPNYFTKCFHDHFGVVPSEYLLSSETK
jgi:signal transduction histidine kinase/DNA-binding response OmpR family regulator